MSISVIVPLYNEHENIIPLYRQLTEVLLGMSRPYELIFVDDGSTDGGDAQLKALSATDLHVKVVRLRRNYGQTAALQAGIHLARGDLLVTIDGDLQNEPADIPMMVARLEEGFDLVHGWRQQRQDAWLNRRLPSVIANWLISRTTRFPIHDLGCTLKVIRREIAQELELYGEMHRFIPILAYQRGARCTEVVTRHHPRRFGHTKYGISRTFRVLLDLVTVKYLIDYFASPMKLFGGVGLACSGIGILAGLTTLLMKVVGGVDMTGNPLLLLTVLSALATLQFLSLGLLGEVNARIYYTTQSKQNYAIREMLNFDPVTESRRVPLRAA